MSLPKVVYVYEDDRYLVASRKVDEPDEGLVGVYDLRETLHIKHPAEARRPGTKTWFKLADTGTR